MSRLPDWRPRLAAYVETARGRPFASGSNDCALFVAGAVAAMTGTDHGAGYRDCYETFSGGLRRVRKAGFLDHVDLVRSLFDEIRVPMAAAGDIAVVPTDEGEALGIVQGARVFVVGPDGLRSVDLLAAVKAFRV